VASQRMDGRYWLLMWVLGFTGARRTLPGDAMTTLA
jgi:hypothetical protein